MRTFLLASVAALTAAGAALAHDFRVGDLVVDHPWASPAVQTGGNGGAFFTIRNEGETADRLLSAETDAAGVVEFHRMISTDGVMSMTPVENVEIAPGEEFAFEPGGAHLMLIGLNQTLGFEDHFNMTLTFENAGEVEVTFNVETMAMHMANDAEAGAEDHEAHMDHSNMDHGDHDGH
ncbi:MAG: copper chaperone PCu(A)C [Maricaulaceae bacterium]|jgi:hypothetical protein